MWQNDKLIFESGIEVDFVVSQTCACLLFKWSGRYKLKAHF